MVHPAFPSGSIRSYLSPDHNIHPGYRCPGSVCGDGSAQGFTFPVQITGNLPSTYHNTTNCAVLGIAIIAVGKNYNAIESFVAGMAAGLGFLLAIVLMSCIREKLADTDIPKPFKGVPIAFITASLMALAFMAFDAALLNNLIG